MSRNITRRNVILFDLDGSLLPMDQDKFIQAYMGALVRKFVPYGFEQQKLIQAIHCGIKMMQTNDGSKTNEQAFWDAFTAVVGKMTDENMEQFEEFYRNEFQQVQKVCGFDPLSAEVIHRLKAEGYRVVLATNPLFPAIATESRIRWAGLEPDDFEFYTTYENSGYCKPNLDYYREILDKIGASAEECIMVGNDVTEDMVTREIGMKVFLLTRDLINPDKQDISQFPNGNLEDFMIYLHG